MRNEDHGRQQNVFAQRHLPERGGLWFRNHISWRLGKLVNIHRFQEARQDDLFTICLAGRTIHHLANCSDVSTNAVPREGRHAQRLEIVWRLSCRPDNLRPP